MILGNKFCERLPILLIKVSILDIMSDQWSASLVQTAVAYLKERDGAVDESIGLIFAVLPQKEMELVYKAVTMVEKAVVTRMVASPSQRAFFQVTSTVCSRDSIDPNAISERKKVVNVCFEHFCTCYTFIHTTIKCPIAMVSFTILARAKTNEFVFFGQLSSASTSLR